MIMKIEEKVEIIQRDIAFQKKIKIYKMYQMNIM